MAVFLFPEPEAGVTFGVVFERAEVTDVPQTRPVARTNCSLQAQGALASRQSRRNRHRFPSNPWQKPNVAQCAGSFST
jgi:hypothetical protein